MKLLLPEVGANQHWPYGLVGDEKSYARQVDGNFFADVKNSSFFLKALKEDAGEKQVDADAHRKTVRLNAKKFMKGNTIVDRKAFIQSLTDAIFEDGLLTLVLGGKSVGKSTVIRSVVANFTQANAPADCGSHGYARDAFDRFFRGCSEHSSAINGSSQCCFGSGDKHVHKISGRRVVYCPKSRQTCRRQPC